MSQKFFFFKYVLAIFIPSLKHVTKQLVFIRYFTQMACLKIL